MSDTCITIIILDPASGIYLGDIAPDRFFEYREKVGEFMKRLAFSAIALASASFAFVAGSVHAQNYYARIVIAKARSTSGATPPPGGETTTPETNPVSPPPEPKPTGVWETGAWSDWSSFCSATATHTRSVVCRIDGATVADEECEAAKPASSETQPVYTQCTDFVLNGELLNNGQYWTFNGPSVVSKYDAGINSVTLQVGSSVSQESITEMQAGKSYSFKFYILTGSNYGRINVKISGNGSDLVNKTIWNTLGQTVNFVGAGAPVIITLTNVDERGVAINRFSLKANP